jgi:hypothetical protein
MTLPSGEARAPPDGRRLFVGLSMMMVSCVSIWR